MAHSVVKKLFDSLAELEGAVVLAKKSFTLDEPENQEIMGRIRYYEEVLAKQKRLAQSLCEFITKENWAEVTRHIRLINGLSSLIHNDARELVVRVIHTHKGLGSELLAR
jgi:hypothetical protein